MSGARSTTRGLVLSTTRERPARKASSMRASWSAPRSRAFGIRSLLTWAWVSAKRDRKNVVLPDAGRPTRMTSSILAIIAERAKRPQPGRGVRLLRGPRARPLREFPGRPVGPAREAALRPCYLRLRPRRRRLRGRAHVRGDARGEAGPVGGPPPRGLRRPGRGPHFHRPGRYRAHAGDPEGPAPRPPLRLPAGHDEKPLHDVGRAPGLLPSLGQPRRAARPAGLRSSRPRPPTALGLNLHGPPAGQPLAGPGRGPAQGPHLRAPRAPRPLRGQGVGPER